MTIWLPDLSKRTGGPLYTRIASAIERDIQSGLLRPGERLPTHRDLADRLGITVGTVSRAYGAAQRAGWLRGEVGRGTYVLGGEERGPRRLEVGADAGVDLSVNLPVDAGSPDLASALRALARRGDRAELLRYQPSEGSAANREAGCEVLRRHGVETSPERVVLCAGAQHGLDVALAALTEPGDSVAAAELTSPGLLPLAKRRGLRVRAVSLDRGGIVPDSLEEVCRRTPIRALYVVPTFQNPTTASLAERRRRSLARLAARFDFVIVEDDIHRLLAEERPPAVAALAPDHAIYVASLSKCLAPGLRIAYLSGPARLRERLVDGVWSSLWMVSPLTAALATSWITDGTLEGSAARKREEAAARQAIARRILGPRARTPTSAYHLWLELGASGDPLRFTAEAAARGVRVTPGDAFAVGRGPAPRGVRIALGAARDREHLMRGLETLAGVLRGETPPATVPL